MGGSGDYLDLADTVIEMRSFQPHERTEAARTVARAHPTGRKAEGAAPFALPAPRAPVPGSLDASRGRREVRIAVHGRELEFGEERIDLRGARAARRREPGARDRARARARAAPLHRRAARACARSSTPSTRSSTSAGLDVLDPLTERAPRHPGDHARPRRFEIAAALNRIRSLRVAALPPGRRARVSAARRRAALAARARSPRRPRARRPARAPGPHRERRGLLARARRERPDRRRRGALRERGDRRRPDPLRLDARTTSARPISRSAIPTARAARRTRARSAATRTSTAARPAATTTPTSRTTRATSSSRTARSCAPAASSASASRTPSARKARREKFTCEFQGLTAGCEDLYVKFLGCQYIDVTGLPSGELHRARDRRPDRRDPGVGRDEQRRHVRRRPRRRLDRARRAAPRHLAPGRSEGGGRDEAPPRGGAGWPARPPGGGARADAGWRHPHRQRSRRRRERALLRASRGGLGRRSARPRCVGLPLPRREGRPVPEGPPRRAGLRARCEGAGLALPAEGPVEVVFTASGAKRYCATFGGTEKRNDAKRLRRVKAASAACPAL